MSTPVVQTQGKARAGYQKVLKIREECEMRFAIGTAKVNSWLPESFAKKSSVLGGLAVGAMLITATTFTYDHLRQDEAASPSSSSQIAEVSRASAYWIQRDEAEEMAYDELSKNFIGIPSPDTKITGRFLPGVVGGISSPAQNPIAATASNELTGNDFRIMEEQRAADRQDDLRDMIQYWNELKEDEATNSTLNNVRQIK
jgi:hypothetical protein